MKLGMSYIRRSVLQSSFECIHIFMNMLIEEIKDKIQQQEEEREEDEEDHNHT